MNACDQLKAEIQAEQAAMHAAGGFDWKSVLMKALLALLDAWEHRNDPTP